MTEHRREDEERAGQVVDTSGIAGDLAALPAVVVRKLVEVITEALAATREEAEKEAEERYAGFEGMVKFIRGRLEQVYYASVFDGSSGDSGPLFVVALRKAVAALDDTIEESALSYRRGYADGLLAAEERLRARATRYDDNLGSVMVDAADEIAAMRP